MTTSQELGVKTFLVQDIIDLAFRYAGVGVSEGTPDMYKAAQDKLELLLLALPNDGLQHWLQQTKIYGLVPTLDRIALPVGAVDILHILYRTSSRANGIGGFSSSGGTASYAFDDYLTTACTQTSPNGYISYDFGLLNSELVTYVGINTNGTNTYNLVWEYGDGPGQWTTALAAGSATYTDNQWAYFELPMRAKARYFRVREIGGAILDVRSVYFGYNSNDITLGRINRDDFYQQTNKPQTSGTQPTNFFLENQSGQLYIRFYSSVYDNFSQLYVIYHRQPYDVGKLTNTLDIPLRWHDSIVMNLAQHMTLFVSSADKERISAINNFADKAFDKANLSNVDRSPVRFVFNTRGYRC